MLLAAMRPEDAMAFNGVGCFLFLVLLMLVMLLVRSLESKLLILGLLTALLSAWIGIFGRLTEAGPVLTGFEASGILGRVAVLLILCASAVIILNRWVPTSETTGRNHP